MKTIARINSDGSLLIKGEVFELLSSWDEATESDELISIDEDTEIDEDLDFEVFFEIITGIKNMLANYEEISFDKDGNVSVEEILEELAFTITNGYQVKVKEIQEGVNLDGDI